MKKDGAAPRPENVGFGKQTARSTFPDTVLGESAKFENQSYDQNNTISTAESNTLSAKTVLDPAEILLERSTNKQDGQVCTTAGVSLDASDSHPNEQDSLVYNSECGALSARASLHPAEHQSQEKDNMSQATECKALSAEVTLDPAEILPPRGDPPANRFSLVQFLHDQDNAKPPGHNYSVDYDPKGN